MTYRILALSASALILAACTSEEVMPSDGLPPPTPDQQFFDCIADGDPTPMVGLPAAQAGAGHPGPVRVIPPGMVITQDYDIKRLNLMTDANGTVLRAYCG